MSIGKIGMSVVKAATKTTGAAKAASKVIKDFLTGKIKA